MQRNELIDTLLKMDEEAQLVLGEPMPKPQVVIVGGAAFMLHDITPRKFTYDIDVYEVDESVSQILSQYPEVNGAVMAYTDQIPYNFEDRLSKLSIGSKTIDFVTPSIEDLIVMKLYAERPNDVQDIDGAAKAECFDWNLLEKLVYGKNEAAASALSETRYKEMTEAYERMKARCGR